jgi:amino acid permease
VSSVNESGGRPAGRVVTAVILAIIAILFIIVGIIYLAEPAKSLPSMIPGHLAGSTGHHPLRAAGTLVLGVIFFVGAWFALSYKAKTGAPAEPRENSPAGQH